MLACTVLTIVLATSVSEAVQVPIDCEDCNENGPWWPLFKPSQLLSSEFPEHRQLRSNDRSDVYEPAPPVYGSRERANSKEQPPEQLRPSSGSRETSGGLEWDHFADVSRVTSVPHNSVETPSGAKSGEERTSRSQEEATKREELPQEDVSFQREEGSFYDDGSEDRFSENFDSTEFEKMFGFSSGEHDASNSIELPFSSGDVFGRQSKPVATSYAKFSSVFAKPRAIAPQGRDLLHPSTTNNNVPNYFQSQGRTPVSHFKFFNNNGLNISKQYLVHEGHPEGRDPGVHQINHGVSHAKPISRNGGPSNPDLATNNQDPFVPANHPVYKYVKNHGGNVQNHQLHQSQAAARWQQPAGQSRTNGQPQNPGHFFIQNHESVVQHVVPTKSPFADTFWKESRKIERLQPPPVPLAPNPTKFIPYPTKLAPNASKPPPYASKISQNPSKVPPTSISPTGHSYLIFKKKPNSQVDFKRINRRQGSNYVYIIRRDKRLTK